MHDPARQQRKDAGADQSAVITLRCLTTRWLRACQTASGTVTSTRIDKRWIGLKRPKRRICWIQKLEMAMTSISAAQT
jgi:hypothetical protein